MVIKVFQALDQEAKFLILPFSDDCLRIEIVGMSLSSLSSKAKE